MKIDYKRNEATFPTDDGEIFAVKLGIYKVPGGGIFNWKLFIDKNEIWAATSADDARGALSTIESWPSFPETSGFIDQLTQWIENESIRKKMMYRDIMVSLYGNKIGLYLYKAVAHHRFSMASHHLRDEAVAKLLLWLVDSASGLAETAWPTPYSSATAVRSCTATTKYKAMASEIKELTSGLSQDQIRAAFIAARLIPV